MPRRPSTGDSATPPSAETGADAVHVPTTQSAASAASPLEDVPPGLVVGGASRALFDDPAAKLDTIDEIARVVDGPATAGERTTLVAGKTAPPTPNRGGSWREQIDTHPGKPNGSEHRSTGWIFVEWSERELIGRFSEFSAVELWRVVESLG